MTDQTAPIDVVLVWGRPGAGKTLFGVASPYKPVLVLDTERSAKLYQAHFKFDWLDCVTFSGPGGLSTALLSIQPGRYGTVVIDTASQWCEWVTRAVFQREAHKVEKQSQLVWGMVKQELRQSIQELLGKTQVIVFTAHDRNKYNGKPGEREPKALDPIIEYAAVSIQLLRGVNDRIPKGVVSKSRLLALPAQLPKANWDTLLYYVTHPADWAHPKEGETVDEADLYPVLAPVQLDDEAVPADSASAVPHEDAGTPQPVPASEGLYAGEDANGDSLVNFDAATPPAATTQPTSAQGELHVTSDVGADWKLLIAELNKQLDGYYGLKTNPKAVNWQHVRNTLALHEYPLDIGPRNLNGAIDVLRDHAVSQMRDARKAAAQ